MNPHDDVVLDGLAFPGGPALARRPPVVLRPARPARRRHGPERQGGDDRRGPAAAVGPRLAARRAHARRLDARPAGAAPRDDGDARRARRSLELTHPPRATTWWSTRTGRAYVGNFGFDMYGGEKPRDDLPRSSSSPTDRSASRPTASQFPNGTVITPDGTTLIVGESMDGRLTAFDDREPTARSTIGGCGRSCTAPYRRRHLPRRRGRDLGRVPVHRPRACACAKAARSLDEVKTTHRLGAFACMLGGADRRTLYVCTAPDARARRGSRSAWRPHRGGRGRRSRRRPALTRAGHVSRARGAPNLRAAGPGARTARARALRAWRRSPSRPRARAAASGSTRSPSACASRARRSAGRPAWATAAAEQRRHAPREHPRDVLVTRILVAPPRHRVVEPVAGEHARAVRHVVIGVGEPERREHERGLERGERRRQHRRPARRARPDGHRGCTCARRIRGAPGVASSRSSAAASSWRRVSITSSPGAKPDCTSHLRIGSVGYAGGLPANTVTTVTPGMRGHEVARSRAPRRRDAARRPRPGRARRASGRPHSRIGTPSSPKLLRSDHARATSRRCPWSACGSRGTRGTARRSTGAFAASGVNVSTIADAARDVVERRPIERERRQRGRTAGVRADRVLDLADRPVEHVGHDPAPQVATARRRR